MFELYFLQNCCVEISTNTLFKFVFQHCIGRRTGNHIIICNFFILCFVDICFNGMLVYKVCLFHCLFTSIVEIGNTKRVSAKAIQSHAYLYLSIWHSDISFINNWIAAARLALEAFKAGSKVWAWWGRLIEDAWYASLHPRAARTRAKRAF